MKSDMPVAVRSNSSMLFNSASFSVNEKLVGQLILLSKARQGIEGRTNAEIKRVMNEELGENIDSFGLKVKITDIVRQGYNLVNSPTEEVYREVSRALGVDEKRYREIWQWVYEHEPNL